MAIIEILMQKCQSEKWVTFFPDLNLGQNWQFSLIIHYLNLYFKLSFIPGFSSKIPSEELRMSESLLEENPLICNFLLCWVWITLIDKNAGSLELLCLELIIALSRGHKKTSFLRTSVINTMTLFLKSSFLTSQFVCDLKG